MCISQAMKFYYCVRKINKQRRLASIQVRWDKPPSNWFKLNTNGASCGNSGRAGGGGLIRNSTGEWVKGFARSIGSTTSIIAKFWALRDGLQLAIQLGVQYLEVELDAKVVLDVISFGNSPTTACSSFIAGKDSSLHCETCFKGGK
nr:putative ribonuclease h protein [Quercus suber]